MREILGEAVFAAEVISVNGLDDRLNRKGVIEEAQQLMAEVVGADQAFFSTCGSSLSVKSAILSVAGPHEKLIVPRHAHKSVTSALVLSGVSPVWLPPHRDAERHLSHPPGPDEVRELFQAEPEAKGMLLVTPNDYGTCGDIAAIAAVCHEFGKPLIVDEAWGAHLPFHPDLPPWGMDAGADVVVTSVHKSGAAVEQSSVFHLQGDLVDPSVLSAREDPAGHHQPHLAGVRDPRRLAAAHGPARRGTAHRDPGAGPLHPRRDQRPAWPARDGRERVRREGPGPLARPPQDGHRRVRTLHQRLPGHRLTA
ncbi:hypothetical protein ABZ345_36415 [Lentzea sp. NPDC005914]|uniref:hypothetical protein n=1 Tax=Lentzea sp. NPDC005914 TaxID=3154572 RepID=UPI00340AAEA0